MNNPQHAHRIAAHAARIERFSEPAIPNGDGIQPTIVSTSGGIYMDASIWDKRRPPTSEDVVGIHRRHHVFMSPADPLPARLIQIGD